MKPLFLASDFAQTASLLPRFLDEPLEGKQVAFIPTASIPEKAKFFVDGDRKALERLGLFVETLEISTAGSGEISRTLEKSDLVFVTGGNSFFLLQEMRRTKAGDAILELIKDGKPYIGSSAGSILLAPDIRYISRMDSPKKAPELRSSAALGAVDFYPLPHFGNIPFRRTGELIMAEYGDSLDIEAINNKQAIAVRGNERRVLSAVKVSRAAA